MEVFKHHDMQHQFYTKQVAIHTTSTVEILRDTNESNMKKQVYISCWIMQERY